MITTTQAVHTILNNDDDARIALERGYMNMRAYAQQIHTDVERYTKKSVTVDNITVILSRLSKTIDSATNHSLVADVPLLHTIAKSPITELSFERTSELINAISHWYQSTPPGKDDFFAITFATSEITISCSTHTINSMKFLATIPPVMRQDGLAALSLTFSPEYYWEPNITFSLIRKVAQKRIVLAETITTHTEIIFTFKQEYLPQMISLFSE